MSACVCPLHIHVRTYVPANVVLFCTATLLAGYLRDMPSSGKQATGTGYRRRASVKVRVDARESVARWLVFGLVCLHRCGARIHYLGPDASSYEANKIWR